MFYGPHSSFYYTNVYIIIKPIRDQIKLDTAVSWTMVYGFTEIVPKWWTTLFTRPRAKKQHQPLVSRFCRGKWVFSQKGNSQFIWFMSWYHHFAVFLSDRGASSLSCRPITFYKLQNFILFEVYIKMGGKNWNARCSRRSMCEWINVTTFNERKNMHAQPKCYFLQMFNNQSNIHWRI